MEYDDDKTAVRKPSGPASAAAAPPPPPLPEGSANVLPNGTRQGEFEIMGLIGEGGFGIVYLANDHSLNRLVALKEYMPSGMASRTGALTVAVKSKHHADTFAAGLRSFINEARLLAQFDSPSLVKVYRFWEANGTAYMVMPYYEGITVKDACKQRRITADESWVKSFLANLLGAVDTIHRVQCYHRDIAPDNILLLKDGRPLLLDFGAARRVIGDLTQGPTVILKPGYAPIEQYGEIPGLRQGPWTDVYAISAVVYFLITGKAPAPAVARIVNDEMVPARIAGRGRFSDYFLAGIDVGLSVKPEQRIQSVANLRRALDIGENTSRHMPPPREPPPRPSASASSAAPATAAAAEANAAQHTSYARPKTAPARPAVPTGLPTGLPGAGATQAAASAPGMEHDDATTPGSGAGWQHSALMSDRREFTPRRKPGAMEWGLFAILLSAAIAGGFYWGSNLSFGPQQAEYRPLPDTAAAPRPESGAPALAGATAPAPPASPELPPLAAFAPSSQDAGAAASRPAPLPASPAAAPPASKADSAAAAEEAAWKSASAGNQLQDYENYLMQFPSGRHAPSARTRLERLQKASAARDSANAAAEAPAKTESAANRSGEDDDLWQAALLVGKPSAFETYLRQFPKGRHAAQARDRLATAKRTELATAQPEAAPAAPAPEPPVAAPKPEPPAAAKAETPAAAPRPETTLARPEPPVAPKVPAPQQNTRPAPAPSEQVAVAPPSSEAQESLPAGATRVIRLANQTMTGDFRSDPATGIVSGRGRIEWSNGDHYDGTLVSGKKEGQGQFVWSNGQRYRGQWSRDQPNGKGTLVFANGNRYEGEVRDGLPHGEGATHFKSGDVHEGRYAEGKMQGQGRYTWANGSYWVGDFRNDQRSGEGQLVFSEKALQDARAAARGSSGAAPTAAGGGEETADGK